MLTAVQAAGQPPQDDPVARHLFPPELIMKEQNEIGLTDSQRKVITDAIQRAQSRFIELQWEMQAKSEQMVRLLEARPVDENTVLAEADRLMEVERQVKKAQLSLLIRIKNALTEAQQRRLMDMRKP
jgi:Spy/CpxP family protein refolding chaperone